MRVNVRNARNSLSLHLLISCVIVCVSTVTAIAQTSSTDGTTPTILTAGAPSGSFPLSGFDNINLFNGNLNFQLPLVKVSGRGEAQYTITLPIEEHWRVTNRSNDYQEILLPTDYTWYLEKPGYSPGVLLGRVEAAGNDGAAPCVPYPTYSYTALTRLTFITSDGTEYELRDQGTGGQVKTSQCSGTGFNRGTIFVTADGSAATFIADAPIHDQPGNFTNFVSGYLLLPNGLRYRIDSGQVTWMRDRNGNKLSFAYGASGVTSITDSLNRQITISYADFNQSIFYDQISFKGFGGAARTIRINYSQLHNVLRTNRAGDLSNVQTYYSLFPELTGSSTTPNDPYKVSSVVLTDGVQQFQFLYNVYGELARVTLPTGGLFEYDFVSGTGESTDGVFGYPEPEIYRRASVKRVYKDVNTLESKTVFGGTVDTFDANDTLLTRQKHYFYGAPSGSGGSPFYYPGWSDGKEYQTEIIDTANCNVSTCATVLRRTVNSWQQGVTVSPWSSTIPNNPRIYETTSTLLDVSPNLVSKRTFGYDDSVPFNNQNNVKEYDFGSGTPGPLLRETRTTYITSSAYTGTSVHIRNLPEDIYVYDGSNVKKARTHFEYDNYTKEGSDCEHSFHCLTARSNVSGFDASFDTNYTTRGNRTATTQTFVVNGSETTSISNYSQYDVLGNVTRSIDPRSTLSNIIATAFEYDDRYGASDGEAEGNSTPAELSGLTSFAYPTKVTNAAGHISFTQLDYYLGRPVNAEDANGIVASGYYNDSLDRPTQIRRAVGTSLENQTTFSYDDTNHIITTTSDRDANNDNILMTRVLYDQMGRTTETQRYEGGANYISVQTQYDALGRAYKTSNPFRPWQSESANWTTQAFDALGRVKTVTTPDSAVMMTDYVGNAVTLTDQAGKKRKSVTDALGRLVQVIEDPTPGVNYNTTYAYDPLDDLTTVTQGSQTRTFVYDSFKRLLSAANPESGSICYGHVVSNQCQNDGYDENGNLRFKTDARGVLTEFRYDSLNRATTILYRINGQPDPNTGDVEYLYDNASYGKGRLWLTYKWGSKPSQTAVGYYDALGRVKQFYNLFGDGQGGWLPAYEIDRNYNLAGNVTSQTYPSGHTVTYNYDAAGRLADKDAQHLAFTGNLGDGTTRTYASNISYSSFGGLSREQFGTTTPLYHKSFYNIRGQFFDTRLSSVNDTWDWNRGRLILYYSSNHLWGQSGTDNNGNVRFAENWIPPENATLDQADTLIEDSYNYDALNRLTSVAEQKTDVAGGWGVWQQQFAQAYSYPDQYGNRIIDSDPAHTWGTGINNKVFSIDTNTNRLGVPNGQSGTMTYDSAGNLTNDTYSGYGQSIYDAENRIVSAQDSYGSWSYYTYNANGQRVRRKINNVETWNIYGLDGELVAEYAASGATNSPQREYGYRNGQLLVTAEASAGTVSTQNVTWTNVVGVSASGNSLTKTAATAWGNAGAASSQSITAGDGYVEFTATETTTYRMCGLSHADSDQNYASIDFAIFPTATASNNVLQVYESGVYRGDFGTYAAGDRLRVAIEGGVVKYKKNGVVFYTSSVTPTYPLLVDTSLYSTGATLTNVVVASATSISGSTIHWLVTDHLGTPRMIVDQSGSLANVKRHDYLPFGEEIVTTIGGRTTAHGYGGGDGVRQQFTLKERDNETGLDYFINRYYSSTQGRFTSVDPTLKSIDPTNPQTLNRYSYALNNPLAFIDPDGLFSLFVGSYDKLTVDQKRLFETYVQQNYAEELKNPLFSAEKLWNDSAAVANGDAAAGPNSRLLNDGQLTNFMGVTNMLQNRGVIDQVASISEIHGDSPEGHTYRIIGELKNNTSAVEAIKKAFPNAIAGKGHGEYKESNREQGLFGAPNGQVSRVPDRTGVDIDVDYRCILCPGHISKGGLGSDIRVGTHYEDGKKRYGAMRALSRTNDSELRPKSLY